MTPRASVGVPLYLLRTVVAVVDVVVAVVDVVVDVVAMAAVLL